MIQSGLVEDGDIDAEHVEYDFDVYFNGDTDER